MKRNLVLREYQIPAAVNILQNKITVLAIAPNGGKTEVSIFTINEHLKAKPRARALVLTHSTNVLKENYIDRLNGLNLDFTYSTDLTDKKAKVHVCLPHSEHLIKGRYHFLIVDEAHENYLAERIQRIIEKIKPKKQLLLTGTPSIFIKEGGYNMAIIAANEIPVEYFSKLQVELVASNYNWTKELNKDYEVKKEYKFNKKDTKKTMELILLKLIERVQKRLTPEEFNNPGIIANLKSWVYTYKKLGKTIIICHSIKHANDVIDILKTNKVNAAVSTSDSDPNSQEVINFKNNLYDVLVVVDRTRLGYSDEDLYNEIDMSGTHNPNMIYQMLARLFRGNPTMQKFYLKVTTQEPGMMDFTQACVNAALMLTDKKYISTFNGSNFKGLEFPVMRNPDRVQITGGNGNIRVNNPQRIAYPEYTNDVIDMFRNIIHDLDKPVSIYKLTTIGEVRATLTGRETWSDEKVFATLMGIQL